jgi:hypothetical protein
MDRPFRQESERIMRTAVGLVTAAIVTVVLGGLAPMRAQQTQVYRLELEIRDARGTTEKPVQRFTMVIDNVRKGVFHAENRVAAGENTVDVGTKIECAVRQSGDQVALDGVIELSEVTGTVNLGRISEPIIGQAKFTFRKTVEMGRPTVIVSEGKLQVEATVDPII